MKKILALLFILPSLSWADTKISALPSTTTLNGGDIIPVVTNPSTSPGNFTITKTNFISTLGISPGGSTKNIQYNTGSSFGGAPELNYNFFSGSPPPVTGATLFDVTGNNAAIEGECVDVLGDGNDRVAGTFIVSGLVPDVNGYGLYSSVSGFTNNYGLYIAAGKMRLSGITSSVLAVDSSGVVISTTAPGITALTGNVIASGNGSVSATLAATQTSSVTWVSSQTVTGPGGLTVKYGVVASTALYFTTTVSTNAVVVQSTTNATIVRVDNTFPVAGDFLLNISTVPGGTGPMAFGVNTYGHVTSSGTSPSVSSCGSTPSGSIDPNSTDFAGTINTGGTSPTSCVLTFANSFVNTPVCVVSDDLQTSEPAVTSRSASSITITLGAALSTGHLFYVCVGQKG